MTAAADSNATAPHDRTDAAQPSAVRLEHVDFAWAPNDPPVLDIESFTVTRGERLYLAGPSGSGKSSLLSLIGGVTEPRGGQVTVFGTNLAALSRRHRDRFRADHVGFVFQLFNLVPYLSMLDNVALPCRFSAARRERATAASGNVLREAERLLSALDLDDRNMWRRPVVDLSIGQQQRVAVARALIGGPELMIADEPTSALDEGTRERFLDLLFRECATQKTTVVFVSHDPRLGELFDRRIALDEINRASPGRH